jgi:flagellar assembly factor FliW
MKIESPRFGTLVVEPSRIIEFPRGLVGLEHCKRFSLFHPEGDAPDHFILQSLDDAAIAFHVVDPVKLGFNYDIVLSDDEATDLALSEAERRVADSNELLAVVVILSKETPDQPVRANLAGPLVINIDTRRGLQHVFVRLEYEVAPSGTEKP